MIKRTQKKNIRSSRGFTLVEMMVSVAIFSIIMVVGIGSLVSIMDKYQVSQQEKEAADSLNFVLETVTREIRLGTSYYSCNPTDSCSSSNHDGSGNYYSKNGNVETNNAQLVGFDSSDSRGYIIYSIEPDGVLYRTKSIASTTTKEPLTDSSQVIIEEARVRVMNAEDPDDLKQPLVWMQFLAHPPQREDSKKVIQTLVSQRILDA